MYLIPSTMPKASHPYLSTAKTYSLLEPDSSQGSFIPRSASNPFCSSASSTHAHCSTTMTNQHSLPSRPGNSDYQIKQSLSNNIKPQGALFASNSAFEVNDSINSVKCRHSSPSNELSELQKAFMARKLIPTRDLTD